jgi:hypothetical protein
MNSLHYSQKHISSHQIKSWGDYGCRIYRRRESLIQILAFKIEKKVSNFMH